jgi:hypothetical protein
MAFRQGAAKEHPKIGAVTESPTLPQGYFRLNPPGERGFWPRAALLVGHRSTWDMLPPRALRAAKIRTRKRVAITGTGH